MGKSPTPQAPSAASPLANASGKAGDRGPVGAQASPAPLGPPPFTRFHPGGSVGDRAPSVLGGKGGKRKQPDPPSDPAPAAPRPPPYLGLPPSVAEGPVSLQLGLAGTGARGGAGAAQWEGMVEALMVGAGARCVRSGGLDGEGR